MKLLFQIILVIAVMSCFFGCGKGDGDERDETLAIFHAGSLAIPFEQISDVFEKENPGIKVLAESAGSRHCARKISDLGRICDVMGSADYKVVSNLLMDDHAGFNIRFAVNEMVVAFNDKSKMGDMINAGNWYEVLHEEGVNVGRADPDSDPCGYRTLMVFQLAERFYKVDSLSESLKEKDTYIRPKETDILALLEAGEVDYTMIYLSIAVQHGLKYITLPDEINLKRSEFADLYSLASVRVSGKKPGEYITRIGEPMVYSVTLPKNAENRNAALLWLELLLSEKGNAIMKANGQPVIKPALVDGFENLPDVLKKYCVQNKEH